VPKNIFLYNGPYFNAYSYGNNTISDIKYKTYIDFNEFNNNNNYDNINKYKLYYLTALIESDDDEGVYQCVNPDWPNFTIRNITLSIASKFLNIKINKS
jgi:hypothetical protein